MLEGKCNKCGRKFYGWALHRASERVCDCSGEIILKEVKDVRKAYLTSNFSL